MVWVTISTLLNSGHRHGYGNNPVVKVRWCRRSRPYIIIISSMFNAEEGNDEFMIKETLTVSLRQEVWTCLYDNVT